MQINSGNHKSRNPVNPRSDFLATSEKGATHFWGTFYRIGFASWWSVLIPKCIAPGSGYESILP
jgi:hypothetical protein